MAQISRHVLTGWSVSLLFLKSIISTLAACKILTLQVVSVAQQASLHITCSQTEHLSVQFVMISHFLFTNQKTGFCTVCYGLTLPVHKPKDMFLYSLLWFHTTSLQIKRQVSVQFVMVSHYRFTNQKTGFCTVCYGFTPPVHKTKDRFLYSLLWFHTTCSQTKRQFSVQFVMVSHYLFTNKDKFLYSLLWFHTTCSQRQVSVQFVMVSHYLFTKTSFCTVCYGCTLPVHKHKD